MLMEKTYRVAGLTFQVQVSGALLSGMANMLPYEVPVAEAVEPLFRLTQVAEEPAAGETPFFRTDDGPHFPEIALYKQGEGYVFRSRPLPSQPVAFTLETDAAFREGKIFFTGTADPFALNNALMLLYAFSSAREGALEMHASVVMNAGKGYLFLGKSGTGKSTHSRLWLENIPGTELLNDDNPILRLMPGGEVRVFGSPWSGKTPCYKAKDVPAGAVVRIRQAPFNAIQKLSPLESYASLMASASSFRPFSELADAWHRTLEALAARVPCYTLDCLPDAAAARLCYETVHA